MSLNTNELANLITLDNNVSTTVCRGFSSFPGLCNKYNRFEINESIKKKICIHQCT